MPALQQAYTKDKELGLQSRGCHCYQGHCLAGHRILTPPTKTGLTALFRKSAAVLMAASRLAWLLSFGVIANGTGAVSKVGCERPARLQHTLQAATTVTYAAACERAECCCAAC